MLTHPPLLPEPVRVAIDGTFVATRILEPVGRPRGEVVLCHGTPWSSLVWADVALELSREYRVFLWDMPGYGESDKGPVVATDLRTQAARLVALLQAWGVQRPHVVAHDIGGAVALRAHLLLEADFAGVFLWDIVTLDPWGSPFFRLVAENADVFAQLPANLHAALVKEYIAGALQQSPSSRSIEALAAPWLGPLEQAAFYRQIAALDPADTKDVAGQLGATRCPTRIGWGRDDPWIPVRQAYELQAKLPGHPDVVVLDGVGHLAPWEHPSAVAAALRSWLDQSDEN